MLKRAPVDAVRHPNVKRARQAAHDVYEILVIFHSGCSLFPSFKSSGSGAASRAGPRRGLDAGGAFAAANIGWRGWEGAAEAFVLGLVFWRRADGGEGCGLNGGSRKGACDRRGCGVFGNFLDHVAFPAIETNLAGIPDRDAERAEDEAGASEVNLVADEGVDDFHERGLDGLVTLEIGDRMEARLGRSADAADHPLMEIAEDFLAQGRRAAADAVDLDVSAGTRVGIDCHV